MRVREATLGDVPAMVAMGVHFHASTIYREQFAADPSWMTATVTTLLDRPDAGVFVAEGAGGVLQGLIVVLVAPHPFSGQVMATELVWWMEPTARRGVGGVRLLRVAEAWARAHGAVALQIGAPMPHDRTVYARLGYQAIETLWQRPLTRTGQETASDARQTVGVA